MGHIETKTENKKLIEQCACGACQRISPGANTVKFQVENFIKKNRKCVDKK